ncbi:MAG: biopolymer transporter ExbD [Planctomycetes bacterium]|nr:biopolymer transporter ExbD [Planctomycetota bacterium]
MRVPNHRTGGDVGFNMTPMIDIVFLLIIFFLVSSHLAQQEVQLELDLPSAASGEPIDDDSTRRLVVNVLGRETPEGQIMVGGNVMGSDRLSELVEHESRRFDGQVEIRIRSNRHVPYRVVEPILLACARAGVWRVSFAVVSEE